MKAAARREAVTRRAGCDPGLGTLLGRRFLAVAPMPAGSVVAGFWPLAGEVDIRPLLHALHQAGHTIALPHTPPRGQPLDFRVWWPGAKLLPGRFGTVHTDGAPAVPDTLLVPLLAYDRDGQRLGYGGGYYDRTLAALPGARAIGCAFTAQAVDQVPVGPYDRPLDAVATEHGVITFRT